jgi:hypothetical protein
MLMNCDESLAVAAIWKRMHETCKSLLQHVLYSNNINNINQVGFHSLICSCPFYERTLPLLWRGLEKMMPRNCQEKSAETSIHPRNFLCRAQFNLIILFMYDFRVMHITCKSISLRWL